MHGAYAVQCNAVPMYIASCICNVKQVYLCALCAAGNKASNKKASLFFRASKHAEIFQEWFIKATPGQTKLFRKALFYMKNTSMVGKLSCKFACLPVQRVH